MQLDWSSIAQTCMAAAAVGLGTVVWRTAILVGKVEARLSAHEKSDEVLQGLILQEVRELRQEGRAWDGLETASGN